MKFPVQQIRKDFPILAQKINGRDLIYFDNAATTQKPLVVIDRINEIHSRQNSSIHRSVNKLSDLMTRDYENARETVKEFIGARSGKEIIFTSGATGSINTVAYSFGEAFVGEGDEIIVSELEHHSNIVPWQMLCERKGAVLKVLPIDEDGNILVDILSSLISEKTKLVSVSMVSNSLGIINPSKKIVDIAHSFGVPVLLDAAQAVQHSSINVQELDCDFLVLSGHKIYGPTGIGVLYGKEKWLDKIPPYQGGGDMIDRVSFSGTTYNELPFKFEAGTTNYIGAIGLGEAIKYIREIGLESIASYESYLSDYFASSLRKIPGIKIYGDTPDKVAIFSFLLNNIHYFDAGMVLDKMGIAIRTGTHCTMPVMEHFGIEGTMRASLCFYNTTEEINSFIEGLGIVVDMFS